MFSPILEAALNNVQIKTLRIWIILLAIINLFFGWVKSVINPDGYNVMNFIFIYVLGRYLKVEKEMKFLSFLKKHPIWMYLISSLFLSSMFALCYIYLGKQVLATKLWAYNNPFVILSAVSLFCCFEKMENQSIWINNIAKCTFPVFLLHTGITIQPIRNMFGHEVYVSFGYGGLLILSVIIFITCSLIAFPIENIKSGLYARIKTYFKSLI